jgi:hypothetical protein
MFPDVGDKPAEGRAFVPRKMGLRFRACGGIRVELFPDAHDAKKYDA